LVNVICTQKINYELTKKKYYTDHWMLIVLLSDGCSYGQWILSEAEKLICITESFHQHIRYLSSWGYGAVGA
jgi:hypothetical protein